MRSLYKAKFKKIVTETGWLYRGIAIEKTRGGNYATPNGEMAGAYRQLQVLLAELDKKLGE